MAVDLSKVGKAMFSYKNMWVNITKEEKEEAFFIFNRYFSKTYPELSLKLNNSKNLDKEVCMDIWFRYMVDKPIPPTFWTKVDIPKKKNKYSEVDIKRVMLAEDMDRQGVLYLMEHHQDLIDEELKYYKQIDKED